MKSGNQYRLSCVLTILLFSFYNFNSMAMGEPSSKACTPHMLAIFNDDSLGARSSMLQANENNPIPFLFRKKCLASLNIDKSVWQFYSVDTEYALAIPKIMLASQTYASDRERDLAIGFQLSALEPLAVEYAPTASVANSSHFNENQASDEQVQKPQPHGSLEESAKFIEEMLRKNCGSGQGQEAVDSCLCMPTERQAVLDLDEHFGYLGALDLVHALSTCLVTCDDMEYDRSNAIPWNIFLFGHGAIICSQDYTGQLPIIANLNMKQFKRVLDFFEHKIKTLTLGYSSCFVGGANRIYPFEQDGTFLRYNYFIISLGLAENFVIEFVKIGKDQAFFDLANAVDQVHKFRTRWDYLQLTADKFSVEEHTGLLEILQNAYTYFISSENLSCFTHSGCPFVRLVNQTNFIPLNFVTKVEQRNIHEWPSLILLDCASGQPLWLNFGTANDLKLELKNGIAIIRPAMPKYDKQGRITGHYYLDSLGTLILPQKSLQDVGNVFMPYWLPQNTLSPLHIDHLLTKYSIADMANVGPEDFKNNYFTNISVASSLAEQAAKHCDQKHEKQMAICQKAHQFLIENATMKQPDELISHLLTLARHCIKQAWNKRSSLLTQSIYPRFMTMKIVLHTVLSQQKICEYNRVHGPLMALDFHELHHFKEQLEATRQLAGAEFTRKALTSLAALVEEIKQASLRLDLVPCDLTVRTPSSE